MFELYGNASPPIHIKWTSQNYIIAALEKGLNKITVKVFLFISTICFFFSYTRHSLFVQYFIIYYVSTIGFCARTCVYACVEKNIMNTHLQFY